MSQAYATLPETTTVDSPDGGRIRSAGSDVSAPSQICCSKSGVSFGPLSLAIPDGGSVCSVSKLTFLPGSDSGDGFLIFGLATGGAAASDSTQGVGDATPDDETDPTPASRRDILALAAAILGAGAVGTETVTASDEETVALRVAELGIDSLDAPLRIRVLDVVDHVLPTSTEILVDADNARVGKIGDPSEGVVLPASTRGTVRVYLRDSESRLTRLLAWAAGIVGGDEEISFSRELPQQASEYSSGEFVTLSDHPAIVEPVATAAPEETVLRIGNTAIPHSDSDGTDEAGSYGVFDDSLIYEVGENPPAASEWELQTRLGLLARIQNRL